MTRAASLSLLVLFGLVVAPDPARADLERALATHPDAAELRALWNEGQQREAEDDLAASAARWARLARALPAEAEPLWRLARIEWRLGERLPPDQKPERLERFQTAETHARRCLEFAPRSAECMFWLAAALGRITTTQGVLDSARLAPVIADLLQRAIALHPTHRDSPDDTTLGNLYHYSAAFYRIVPDWFWLSWVLGVRGDKERSVDFSRRAVAISPQRLDYQVELGAGLLCLGTRKGHSDLVREGEDVLRQSQSLEAFAEASLDATYTQLLLERPDRACSYARDGWIDVGEGEVRGAMLRDGVRDRDS
jgi:tetratricopeptide (TPR) repeat protein